MKRISKKRGFTLIELLVVLGIIGVLASTLTVSIGKGLESARASKCKSNLRNLAQAALACGNENSAQHLPTAGSYDYVHIQNVNGRYRRVYVECKGWVGWVGRPAGSLTSPSSAETANCFTEAESYKLSDHAYMSLTNGALWQFTGRDINTYRCEQHRKACRQAGKHVLRSYVMNGYFGYAFNGKGKSVPWRRVPMGSLSRHGDAGRLLMFAEMPCYRPNSREISVDTSEQGADGVLQAEITDSAVRGTEWTPFRTGCQDPECFGFNHRVGGRNVAHVAFADGHVEVLSEPRNATEADLKDLTKYLCNGAEVDESILKRMH